MPLLQRKDFASSDDVRVLGRGRFVVVNLDETAAGRIKMEPGWRWSLHVVADDGTELDTQGGDAYEIPPGHDARVVGNTPYESIAMRRGDDRRRRDVVPRFRDAPCRVPRATRVRPCGPRRRPRATLVR